MYTKYANWRIESLFAKSSTKLHAVFSQKLNYFFVYFIYCAEHLTSRKPSHLCMEKEMAWKEPISQRKALRRRFDRPTPGRLLFSPQKAKYFSNSLAKFLSQMCGSVAEGLGPPFFLHDKQNPNFCLT